MTLLKKNAAVCAMLAALLALGGCGYHTAGKASRLPTDIHTIAVPAFINQTTAFRLEQVLTEATAREFVSRTHYHVVSDPAGADAVLKGTIIGASTAPATYDTQTGRASTALVVVYMNVSLADRNGKVLFQQLGYEFREQYQISRELSSFFQEESPAYDRLSRDFARTLVSNILEAW